MPRIRSIRSASARRNCSSDFTASQILPEVLLPEAGVLPVDEQLGSEREIVADEDPLPAQKPSGSDLSVEFLMPTARLTPEPSEVSRSIVANIRASCLATAKRRRRISKPRRSARATVSMTLECLTGNQVLVGGGASIASSSSRVTVLAPQWVTRVEPGDDTVLLLPGRR